MAALFVAAGLLLGCGDGGSDRSTQATESDSEWLETNRVALLDVLDRSFQPIFNVHSTCRAYPASAECLQALQSAASFSSEFEAFGRLDRVREWSEFMRVYLNIIVKYSDSAEFYEMPNNEFMTPAQLARDVDGTLMTAYDDLVALLATG
ncbi:MAG: hypothetical protein K8R99_05865 [Actinomycetia bacterium]|nr:hypothetical protein [Actinomycetes bacterium]